MSERTKSKKTIEKTIDFDICKAIDERGKTMLTFCKVIHALATEHLTDKSKQDAHENS